MARRALSLALAASVLAGSLYLSTLSLWIWGPVLYFPFVGAPAVAGMMALRAALMRELGAPPDPTARALEVIALGAMLAPGAGFALALAFLGGMEGDHCGLRDPTAVATVLGLCWPLWGAGEVIVVAVLVRGRAALARLPWYRAVATILTLIGAPPLAVLAYVATCFESFHGGGAGTAVLLPAAIAAGATLLAWTVRHPSATAAALRRLVAAVLTLEMGVFLVLSRTPLSTSCASFWTTTTWRLVSDCGWAVAPCLAVMFYCARDPISPTD